MKTWQKISISGAFFLAALAMLAVSTTISGVNLINSTVDHTVIGGVTPASGTFSSLTDTGLGSSLLAACTTTGGLFINSGCGFNATQMAGLAGSRSIYSVPSGFPSASSPTSSYVYHNTNSVAMMVTVSADYNGGGGFWAAVFCDASSAPTTVVAQFSRVNDGSSPPDYYPEAVTFIVPAGYYYGISGTSTGGPTPLTWTEWVL